MIESSQQRFLYRVDANDLLVWVDSWWLAFARENGASELTEARVLGRSLWDYIADDGTRRLYREIHEQIRASGRRAVLPFRCDSPTVRRHMRLTITTGDAGRLCYESVLLLVEPRSRLRLLDRDFPRSEDLLTMCSCCKRALIESVGWLDIDEVAARLRLFERQRAPQLRHAVCPECAHAPSRSPENGNAA
jgi:hypothetical protein